MVKNKVLPHMKFKGIEPLAIIEVDDTYILAVYQGFLSEYDLLIKYRQSDKSTKSHWSRKRTPKHIHWAVDVIIKMQYNMNIPDKIFTPRYLEQGR